MGSHIEVQDAAPVMGQQQKHIENLETNGRHGKEVDGDQLLGMILQEGAPSLRRRFAGAHHVFAHAALRDSDSKLEQLPVDAGCAPTRILAAHSADEISDLAGNCRSSRLAKSDFPGPEETKALAMPGNDGLGLNDSQRGAPVAPHARHPDPEEAVYRSQPGTFSRGTLRHADLLPQGEVLQLEGCA